MLVFCHKVTLIVRSSCDSETMNAQSKTSSFPYINTQKNRQKL